MDEIFDLEQKRNFTNLLNSLSIKQTQLEQIEHYIKLLNKWGGVYNLTGKTENIYFNLLDSVYLALYITNQKYFTIADLGSGGGLPVIACALINPEKNFYAFEINEKKRAFLQQVAMECQINNIRFNKNYFNTNDKFEMVISKAALTFSNFLKLLINITGPAGEGVFFTNPSKIDELILNKAAKNMLISQVLYRVHNPKINQKTTFTNNISTRGFLIVRR